MLESLILLTWLFSWALTEQSSHLIHLGVSFLKHALFVHAAFSKLYVVWLNNYPVTYDWYSYTFYPSMQLLHPSYHTLHLSGGLSLSLYYRQFGKHFEYLQTTIEHIVNFPLLTPHDVHPVCHILQSFGTYLSLKFDNFSNTIVLFCNR